jgi:hypothetical protein
VVKAVSPTQCGEGGEYLTQIRGKIW